MKKDCIILGFLGTLFVMALVTHFEKMEFVENCKELTGNSFIACETIYEYKENK